MKVRFLLLAALLAAPSARAWEVGEFRNGMPRAQVEAALRNWDFGRVLPVGTDGLFAYDPNDTPGARRFLFSFCNDKLVSLEQDVAPAFRNFVIIASNYSNLYGNPAQVLPYTSVVASGEKDLLAMFWRRGGDYFGLKYVLYANGEQLSQSWQVSNNCWQAPR